MNNKITLLLLMCNISFNSFGMKTKSLNDWTNSKFFNTKYLRNYLQVAYDLKANENFTDAFFFTSDDLLIHGLFYNPKNATRTIIFCAGWFPGRKEGMIPFYPMLKNKSCAMLFFDARGHGISDGSMWRDLYKYGQHEYKDIIAAIQFVYKKNENPIYLLGVCAGAFHAAHALIKLGRKAIKKYNITGLIFDSGWIALNKSTFAIPEATVQEKIIQCISCGKKNNRLYRIIRRLTRPGLFFIHSVIFRPLFYWSNYLTNLHNAWKKNPPCVPVLFIHSHDDPTNIQEIQQLAQLTQDTTCWWIKHSKHACHNLKHKKEYQKKLLEFFEKYKKEITALGPSTSSG